MSKKQTIRTLGSIERTQPTQPTPKKQDKLKTKKLDLELDVESDDNIENFSDGNDDGDLEEINLKSKIPDVKAKKKRVISDDQKKVLVERLAYARSLRKKESENKKSLEDDYLKQKEEEINERLMKKFTSLQRKKENEMLKKYMAPKKSHILNQKVMKKK